MLPRAKILAFVILPNMVLGVPASTVNGLGGREGEGGEKHPAWKKVKGVKLHEDNDQRQAVGAEEQGEQVAA